MEYNLNNIGKRIRTERMRKGFSQDDLIDSLGRRGIAIGRNSISKIENGDFSVGMGINLLVGLCREFDCDMGYLLCEYDEKHHVTSDICAETGLSEKTVERIRTMNRKGRIEAVNLLFEAEEKLLNGFLYCLYSCKRPRKTQVDKLLRSMRSVHENLRENFIYTRFLENPTEGMVEEASLSDGNQEDHDVAADTVPDGTLLTSVMEFLPEIARLSENEYLRNLYNKSQHLGGSDDELYNQVLDDIKVANADRDRGYIADAQRFAMEIASQIIEQREKEATCDDTF